MRKRLFAWQIAGFVFTGIFGVLLHFLFDWSGENTALALFSAVNESTWEHIKLLFFPMFLFAWIESRALGSEYENFWCVKGIGILTGSLLIPVLYYTLNGACGAFPDWVNIAIYFVSVAASYLLETILFLRNKNKCRYAKIALLILWLIALVFVIYTFVPLQIPLFEDPLTGTYGIWQTSLS